MDKEGVVHTYNEILLGHKKNAIRLFGVTQMDLDCHTEGSQSDRERQISYDVIYIWSLKK